MKKLILTSILTLVILATFASPVLAADPPSNSQPGSENIFYTAGGYAKGLTEGLVGGNFSNIIGSGSNEMARLWFMTMAMGSAPKELYANAQLQANLPLLRSGALSYVGEAIASTYQYKPASTGQYIAYYQTKMGFPVKSAYAQGIGFSGLSPLLPLWTAFRNIAYGFLIIMMVIVGFMVLFRMKIDPRTVITIQDAIPRIIITLILITFSYTIVGLMIDLMYLLIFLFIFALHSTIGTLNFSDVVRYYSGGSLPDLFSAMWTTGTSSVDELSTFVGGSTGGYIISIATAVIGFFTGPAALLLVPLGIGGIINTAVTNGNPLVFLLIGLALLFTFIRILVLLITAYAQVVISVIFGPLQLMFGAIPNVDAFGSWFKDLIANLAVFPIVIVMLLVATIISSYASSDANANLWRPPGLAGSFAGRAIGSGVSGIISLGLVFMIPTIAGSIKEVLKAKPLVPGGVGAVTSPITSVYGTAMQGISNIYYLRQMGILKNPFASRGGGGTHQA